MGTSVGTSVLNTEAGQVGAQQLTTQQRWDEYVAAQLSSRKDGAGQAKLISTLEAQLAQPGESAARPCPIKTVVMVYESS